MNKDLAYVKLMLEDISMIADKVTSGNVSHNIATIKCDARKALECLDSLQEEPISNPIDFEKELYKAFGQVKDFTLGMRIAKRFYDMGKKSREPVCEELEKEINKWIEDNTCRGYCSANIHETAEHFFELGLKAKDWKNERMKKCPFRQVGCTIYEGKILECKGVCSWVLDYPKLKELKAQKGE